MQGSPVFSSDGRRVAYAAKKAGKCLVVVDGQPGPEHDRVPCGPVFRSDGVLEYLAVEEAAEGSVLYRVTHAAR